MRIRSRTLLTAAVAGLFLVQAGPAEADHRRACVWYDIESPVYNDDDEECTPYVLPHDMNDHHEPEDCNGVPPLNTEWCVGADFYLYGG